MGAVTWEPAGTPSRVTARRAHPYMANSTEEAKQLMLDVIGVSSVDELFEQIPLDHIHPIASDFPPALTAEFELRRHLMSIIGKNGTCEEYLSFLGAGAWQHHVPAICDEIWSRSEFLTSVWGTGSSDLGRNQAWFEYASQLGELVGMDFVGLPVYSWGAAIGHAMRMAARITERSIVLVPDVVDPQRMAVARTYCGDPALRGYIDLVTVAMDPATGGLDLSDLSQKLTDGTAAVYFEVPSYLGCVEQHGAEIAAMARAAGAETIVGVDPISLGVLAPPSQYGADIIVGTTQTLGVHMNGGGGVGGFIATRDEEVYARQYPTLQVSITGTLDDSEVGFAMTLFEQTSYGSRELGNDWTGNSVYLWAIVNAAYMALMGPRGFHELGASIVQRSHYAAHQLAQLPGVAVPWQKGFFREFLVDFNGTGFTVATVNDGLLERGIFGGKDLSSDFTRFGQSALYCVTELHSMDDIDRLVGAIQEVISQ